MPEHACPCGTNLPIPSDPRRFQCPTCERIYDALEIDGDSPMPHAARPEDWKRDSPDEAVVTHAVQLNYGAEDMRRIRWGLIPRSMDDRYFIYADGDMLYFHRSWTGRFCYKATLAPDGVNAIHVARDIAEPPAQSLSLVQWLIERFLLGRAVGFPFPG